MPLAVDTGIPAVSIWVASRLATKLDEPQVAHGVPQTVHSAHTLPLFSDHAKGPD